MKALCLGWLLALPTLAQAEGRAHLKLVQANDAWEHLHLTRATELAGEGLLAGDGTPLEVAQLYTVMAKAVAVSGNEGEATRDFAAALELMPGLRLPPGTSPKVLVPLERARADARALQLDVQSAAVEPRRVRTRVTLAGDGSRLAASAKLHILRPAPSSASGATLGFSTLPGQLFWDCPVASCGYSLSVQDSNGNTVVELGSERAPFFVQMPTPLRPRPWYATRWPYLALGSAGAITAAVFGTRYFVAQGKLHSALAHPTSSYYQDVQTLGREEKQSLPFFIGACVVLAGGAVTAAFEW